MFTRAKCSIKRRNCMKRITTLLITVMLSSTTLGYVPSSNLVYQAGGQYTAVLDTQNSQWHMIPRVRQDLAQQAHDCHSNTDIPTGLWLITRDANGNPELLAPSHTTLPAGHSGHIPIISCSDLQGNGIAIPAKMIDWLSKKHRRHLCRIKHNALRWVC